MSGDQAPERLSIVMPAYNEEATIEEIVRKVLAVPFSVEREIIIVDDCSTDQTQAKLMSLQSALGGELVRVFRQQVNQGKGAAVSRGYREATGDVVVVQDADMEYDPRDLPGLLAPILAGEADVVYGSRYSGGRTQGESWTHWFGNRALTWLSNVTTGFKLTDMETCYKMFRREALEGVHIRSRRFGIEPEITAKMARRKMRLKELPISYDMRWYADGKKITWRDGLKAIFAIFYFRFFN